MSDKVGTFSARWRASVLESLGRRSRQLDTSRSRLAERYVEEGLKMDEFPEIMFRDGPTGRRAGLIGGLDLWELIQTFKSSSLTGDEAVAETADLLNLSDAQVRNGIRYYAAFPEEIDQRIEDNLEGAEAAEAAWKREQAILG